MKIIIVEDEKVAARRVKRMIEEALAGSVQSLYIFTTIEDAFEHLSNNQVDLVFLDLNLNGDDGFDILRKFTAREFQTIIISANTDQAIEAFDLGVLDFIPKPFDTERLQRALNRFTGRYNRLQGTSSTIVVKKHGKRTFVSVGEILYISGAGDYTELHCQNSEMHLYSKSLEKLMQTLPEQFIRIHKSHIVNRNAISEVSVYGGGKYVVYLDNGTELPMSRSRYKEYRELFGAD